MRCKKDGYENPLVKIITRVTKAGGSSYNNMYTRHRDNVTNFKFSYRRFRMTEVFRFYSVYDRVFGNLNRRSSEQTALEQKKSDFFLFQVAFWLDRRR